uniref:Alanine--tRNA ligase n=1 Tax=Lygus hesperus TaxID=30085 RepID=A0A0A9WZJ8_LYGHE
MENPNFEQKFKKNIEKVRYLLECLPRLVSNSEVMKPHVEGSSCESSINVKRVTPKVECGKLLQSNQISPDSISISELQSERTSTVMSNVNLTKKKKKKKKLIDPLRPTKKRSFGVDIGQGINTIVYIRENCCPFNETRKSRLLNIFVNPLPTMTSEKSMENIYRQLPLSQETSSSNVRTDQTKKVGRTESEVPDLNVLFAESDDDLYKIRYIDFAAELPNDFGIDDLQALFVPYHMGER